MINNMILKTFDNKKIIIRQPKQNDLKQLHQTLNEKKSQKDKLSSQLTQLDDLKLQASKLKEHQLEFCKHFKDFDPSQSAILATTQNTSYKFYTRPNGTIRIPLGESITTWLAQKNTL